MIPFELDIDIERASWTHKAECAKNEISPDSWFPFTELFDTYETKAALQICKRCPVQRQCLEYAIIHWPIHGIWGGFRNKQIKSMVQEIEKVKSQKERQVNVSTNND